MEMETTSSETVKLLWFILTLKLVIVVYIAVLCQSVPISLAEMEGPERY